MQIEQSLRQDRMMAALPDSSRGSRCSLTCIGLFGTVAYGVERRMREIGIRLALGAGRAHVLRAVVGDTVLLVGLGAAMGVGLAFASTHILEHLLFGITANDRLTMLAVIGG